MKKGLTKSTSPSPTGTYPLTLTLSRKERGLNQGFLDGSET